MTAPLSIIINAASGNGRDETWVKEIEDKFRARGLHAQGSLVHNGAEIDAAVKKALDEGARLVVAAGGDGTVSAVASALAGTERVLGVLPMGTLNHFAKDLGIPIDVDAAIDVIANGREIPVDVGEVNGRRFINNSSLGLYPDVVLDRESQRRRLGRGKWAALAAASVHALRRYPVLSLRLEVDGRILNRRSAFVFIGNNEYAMEGFEIGARPSVADGKLSLYVTQRTGRFGLLVLAFRALFHRLRQARDFDMLMAESVTIESHHKSLRVATDGEVTRMQAPLNYRIQCAALRVMAPVDARNEGEGL